MTESVYADPEQVVRRYVEEVLNKGNLSAFEELVAPGYTDHSGSLRRLDRSAPAGQDAPEDRESVKQNIQTLRRAVPDLRYTINALEATGDRVTLEWTARGTHKGSLEGWEATNKQGELSGTSWARVENGRLVEGGSDWDLQQLLELLGLAQ